MPDLQGRQKTTFIQAIMEQITTYNRYSWIDNKKWFEMDLDQIYKDTWLEAPTDTGNRKTRMDRKTALVQYLVRLWIMQLKHEPIVKDPKKGTPPQVYGITVLINRGSPTKARVYLRSPPEGEKIPAI